MKKNYIIPKSVAIALHTESMLAGSPGEGLTMGGKADGNFQELSKKKEDAPSIWDGM